MGDAAVKAVLARLEEVTTRLEKVEKQLVSGGGSSGSGASSSGGSGSSASVSAFDAVIASFGSVIAAADKIGDAGVKEQAAAFATALQRERELLEVAASSKKPSNTAAVLDPTSKAMQAVGACKDKNRASKNVNHLTALAEAVNGLGWVAVSPTPGPFVDDARQAAEFYTNRILKDFKGKDDNHVAFANGLIQFLKDLRQFVKDHHTTELAWNPKGGEASVPTASASSSSSSSSAPPPAGPPPPPASLAADLAKGAANDPPARGALFAEINKGNVTGGLKHVDKSQMTHKNPNLRAGSTVPTELAEKKPAAKKASGGAAAAAPSRPPKLELQGNKWVVEFQKDNKTIEITDTEPRQVVYIYKCENSVVQVKGKINAITVDSCKKTALVFEECIATVEVVNCTSLQVQVTHKVPSFAIDNTAGCQVFLNPATMHEMEIVTSKSCEMNIAYTDPKTDELVEVALPEQYKTTISKDRKVTTHSVDHI